MAVENEIGQIAAVHQIGSLSLETGPLRASLKSEAASWKAQFARNLHKQGADDLKVSLIEQPLANCSRTPARPRGWPATTTKL